MLSTPGMCKRAFNYNKAMFLQNVCLLQVTQGYTTEEKCSTWPTQRCSLQKQKVKKYSPETECKKVPFELCGPAGCPVEPGQEQCQEKKETVSFCSGSSRTFFMFTSTGVDDLLENSTNYAFEKKNPLIALLEIHKMCFKTND